ncbi:pyruvate dehydrogenase complex dihydrolipoamide acetyltransferase [Propionimicrobium sp. PCR01-08-3]|uniref:pyruvate dehydrogenase complex dihydrolipoamide acetyltransferase n=1 Tax=Propionimicrobium sp. PCR01-08-3 TaxID=3052086 RepID=UPI00255C56A1|nr:pyruvate dehydrogenase complex dihydrolipoamide acetyltransferase [Propionimicrobium sp. PCR01-08-3]WIY81416.1 pyruvate dehydrogenase complex dihydrolipoamide acetyltransferase [Propionimicrobium sp. PCR01-08-3]
MATVVLMPAVVADAEDAVLTSWLVTEGDQVTKGQELAEIETDKANVEVEAETVGTVGRLIGSAGDRIAVGAPIAVLLKDGEDASAIDAALGVQSAPEADEPAAPLDAADAPATQPVSGTPPEAAQTSAHKPGERIFASPLARRIAAEHGLDIAQIPGRGPRGRVIRADVEAAIAAGKAEPEAESAATSAAAEPAAEPAAASAAPRRAEQVSSEPVPDAGGAYEDIPLTGMRRAIARRLSESKATIPHWYVTVDARLDALLTYRKQLNEASPVKISVNDLLVKAIASTLQAIPAANACWNGDSIRRYNTVDISVAVSTPAGLVTPVVRGVEKLGMSALAETTKDLIERARDGKLKQKEIEGGSFSISNLGMYGVRDFCAIINPPQSAILAVGAAEQRAVVTDGEAGVATVMSLTLSSDHRVIDGALAAEFMQALKARLENPVLLAL